MNTEFSHNDEVTIYPSEEGWKKIHDLVKKAYDLNDLLARVWVDRRRSGEGYRDQLWVIIDLFHSMFFNGQKYFENTNIKL